jgi:hypothetical protein
MPAPHSLSAPLGQSPKSPQDCTKNWQMHWLLLARTQQLQLPSPHGIGTLHGSEQPQASSRSQGLVGVAENAGVLTLVRIGAVQATAAPAPILLIIRLLEMPSFGSSSSTLTKLTSSHVCTQVALIQSQTTPN